VKRPLTVAVAAASLLGVTAAPAVAAAGTAHAPVAGTVRTGGTPLNVRAGVTSGSSLVGRVTNGGRVSIACFFFGQTIAGTVRTSRAWDRLTSGHYVADAYIVRAVSLPLCATATAGPEPAATRGAYMLPVAAGIVSGYRSPMRPTHDGVDLGAARFTPIHAAAAGRVITVVCNVSTHNCDVDGSPSLTGCGWYVEILHADGYVTRYCHMVRRPSVSVGQVVAKGQVIGFVGTSGSSSGPHLHFEVHSSAPATRANAMNPIPFMRAKGLLFGG
jgi:murein DD-endopeptidase MepM/ murein hydrolase activator NlpD